MDLDQFRIWALDQGVVCKHAGSGGLPFCGECVSLINQYCWKVLSIQAMAWGHAKDWGNNAATLYFFDLVSSPRAGDIGVSDATRSNPYGHIRVNIRC